MKRIYITLLVIMLYSCFNQLQAQYSVKTYKQNTGEIVTYSTPSYLLPKYKMFTSFYYLFFQKIDEKIYVVTEYVAWNNPYLDPSNIVNVSFVFTDGYEFVIPVSYYYKKTQNLVPEYNGTWSHYAVMSYIDQEQLRILSCKQLISISNNFKNTDKIFDIYVPDKKGISIAMTANYFLTGEKISKDSLYTQFTKYRYKAEYNDDKWDF